MLHVLSTLLLLLMMMMMMSGVCASDVSDMMRANQPRGSRGGR